MIKCHPSPSGLASRHETAILPFSFVAALGLWREQYVRESHSILGKREERGELPSGDPFRFLIHFRNDSTYDGIANGKPVVNGRFRVSGNTVFFRDAICNSNYEGLYRTTFFRLYPV